jgi:hypothetical protein
VIPTVLKPIRDQVPKDQFEPWMNKELLPLLSQMRQALNYFSTTSASITTAGTGVMTTIFESADVAVGSSVLVDTTIMGIATGATSAFKITGLFRNPGTFAQEGVTFAMFTQNTAGFAVQYLVVDNHFEVQVQDDGALDVDWTAIVTALEIS